MTPEGEKRLQEAIEVIDSHYRTAIEQLVETIANISYLRTDAERDLCKISRSLVSPPPEDVNQEDPHRV